MTTATINEAMRFSNWIFRKKSIVELTELLVYAIQARILEKEGKFTFPRVSLGDNVFEFDLVWDHDQRPFPITSFARCSVYEDFNGELTVSFSGNRVRGEPPLDCPTTNSAIYFETRSFALEEEFVLESGREPNTGARTSPTGWTSILNNVPDWFIEYLLRADKQ
jgi:hypothetical protein